VLRPYVEALLCSPPLSSPSSPGSGRRGEGRAERVGRRLRREARAQGFSKRQRGHTGRARASGRREAGRPCLRYAGTTRSWRFWRRPALHERRCPSRPKIEPGTASSPHRANIRPKQCELPPTLIRRTPVPWLVSTVRRIQDRGRARSDPAHIARALNRAADRCVREAAPRMPLLVLLSTVFLQGPCRWRFCRARRSSSTGRKSGRSSAASDRLLIPSGERERLTWGRSNCPSPALFLFTMVAAADLVDGGSHIVVDSAPRQRRPARGRRGYGRRTRNLGT
jgi:hypothetical protein